MRKKEFLYLQMIPEAVTKEALNQKVNRVAPEDQSQTKMIRSRKRNIPMMTWMKSSKGRRLNGRRPGRKRTMRRRSLPK